MLLLTQTASTVMNLADEKKPVQRNVRGLIVPLVFGFIFFEANAGSFPGAWQATIGVLGVAVGVLLVVAINRVHRSEARAGGAGPGQKDAPLPRRFWVIAAAEFAAIIIGVVVVNAVGAHALSVPWIALIVGIHFFGLVGIFGRDRQLDVLGVVITLLAVAGFVLYAAGAPHSAVAAVPGLGSGAALYVSIAVALATRARARRGTLETVP